MNELQQMLSEWKIGGRSFDEMEYFGQIYSNNKSWFKFSLGERKLIEELSTHVKGVFRSSDTMSGVKYFNQKESKELIVIDNGESIRLNEESKCTISEETRTHYFIRKLLATADQNVTRAKNGFRYDEDIRVFATYVRMFAGPKLYNFLHKNLELAIPALSSVNRYVHTSNCRIIEGVLRREELLLYLKQRDLEPLVSLSEDATRIVG